MANHGVNVSQQTTSLSTPVVAASGIPFVIGVAPVQSAESPSSAGIPILCTSWTEAVEKLGYSDNWDDYPLCEFMYSHFKLFGCQPVMFCNMLNVSSMKETVEAQDLEMTNHKAKLPIAAINDEILIVKPGGGTGDAYVMSRDYSTYYDGEYLVIESLPEGSCYDVDKVNVSYSKVTPSSVTNTVVASGLESIELCLTLFGIVPDLICAPGYSSDSTVAAVMATKAGGINGLFPAKALIDISSGEGGAKSYSETVPLKNSRNLVDADQILCWPMLKLGAFSFHQSTQLAGLMSQVDTQNGGCPYESPSNKNYQCDAMVLEDGTEVNLTLTQANFLNANGIVTALNFMGGWTCWGNYTACYPGNTDVKDYFISVSRMFGWIGNSIIRTYWSKLDKPMNRRLVDTIKDAINIWLNGLVGSSYLLGARVEFLETENPTSNLMSGIIKFHIYMTPPSPAQEIDFVLEYDAEYVATVLTA